MKALFLVGLVILVATLASAAGAADVRLHLGQGGLCDERPPDGKLGGGQLALDMRLAPVPLVASLAAEYHKKSAEASHPYEINPMLMACLLYRLRLPTSWPADVYAGGGIDGIEAPRAGADGSSMVRGVAFDGSPGVSAKAHWKIGAYLEAKYIYSTRKESGHRIIDFSDFGALIGLSFDLGWWSS